MKIVYSFDTKGGSIIPGSFYTRMAKLSVYSAKKLGYPVILYADLHGINFFRTEKFPFDEYHLVDVDKYDVATAYWNFVKLLTYSKQEEPFLHVDFDTYFHDGFTIPKADIITEMLRDYTFVKPFRQVAINPTNAIPAKLICSGLIGGYNTNVWKELFERAVEVCPESIASDKAMAYLVGIEEFNISQLADFYQLSVSELNHTYFDHWQGANKEKNYGKVINELYNINFSDYEKSF